MASTPCFRLLAASALLLLPAACGGGGGSAVQGQNPVTPPAGVPAPPFTAGLLAAAAGPGTVHLTWSLPGTGFEAALYSGTDAGTLYQGAPFAENLTGSGMQVTGLTDGVTRFFGLAVRAAGQATYRPTGVVLRARPGARIYVDSSLSGVGDGMSPATAFRDLDTALQSATLLDVGNVWVRAGIYEGSGLELDAGIHVYGGFDASFSLATRDPDGGGTLIAGVAGQVAFDVQDYPPGSLTGPAVIDGFRLAGGRQGLVGVDADDVEVELRSLQIDLFTDRGIRLRNALAEELDVQVAGVTVAQCGADGLSLAGAFDLRVHGSAFDSNAQEGLDCDALVALAGGVATLHVEGSRFFGNGRQGLDADLAAPVPAGAGGGRFEVTIRGCRFERNGVEGLLLDHDFEGVQGYSADLVVRESLFRANRAAGVRIDADGEGSTLIHRCLATANGGDGYAIGSESRRGLVLLSASAATANQNAGARSLGGNKNLVGTHCVFAGNRNGGFLVGGAEGALSSSITFLQRTPVFRAREAGNVDVQDAVSVSTFVEVPEYFTQATSIDGDRVNVLDASGIDPSTNPVVELGDDGVPLDVISLFGNQIRLNPMPVEPSFPAAFTVFPSGLGVDEDYRLTVGSPGRDAGLAEPGADPVDAGVFGSPDAGDPGRAARVPRPLFYPVSTTPQLSIGVARNQALEIRFNRTVAPSQVLLGRVRTVKDDGTELMSSILSFNEEVILMPPGGDWGPDRFVVELHVGLAANDGTTLTTPMVLPVSIRQ